MSNAGVPSPAGGIRGLSNADWLFRRIAADPLGSLTAAVVGSGGTGKTLLLDEVARAYGKAGVEVVRPVSAQDVASMALSGKAVLVDDAHRLDEATLDRLRTHSEDEGARLMVAYRPWPRSISLSALGASVARGRPVVVVGHLSREDVAARVAERLGVAAPGSLVDLVHEQSGGLPALVDLVTQALQDGGWYDVRQPERFRRPERVGVSAGSAERLRHRVETLRPEVYALLQAMAVGADLDAEVLSELLDVEPEGLVGTVEAALATGLIVDGGRLIPYIRSAVLRLMPGLQSREMLRKLAGIQLDRGGSVLDAGRRLVGTGATGSRVAAVLEAAGEEALRQSPALAAELFAGAVDAGCPTRVLAARRATAVALNGDLDQALRLVDEVVADPSAPDHGQGVSVLAAVMAHRGLPARSAALHLRVPGAAALSVPALVGTGALKRATEVLDEEDREFDLAPTLLAEAATLMARGVVTSIDGSPTSALSQLARAAALIEPAGPTVLLPDTPAALTALVALHHGELTVAASALRRGLIAKSGGRPAQIRNLLLYGWTAMVRGNLGLARRTLDRVTKQVSRLEPREEIFSAALATALARRADDLGALATSCARARDALVSHPVDLYTLQPLGELAVAAAALGDSAWVTPHLLEAGDLLDRLGGPVLWAGPLHWCRLQAAIVADDAEGAERHAAALTDAESTSPYATALGSAARAWLQVQTGRIDRETVEPAARRLHEIGLTWEGSRLAGQAAMRATDRRVISALHMCARALQGAESTSEAAPASDEQPREPAAAGGSQDPPHASGRRRPDADSAPVGNGVLAKGTSVLSEREFEVSQLILEGLTYKQIGQRLFISAKTVEHHVARIRQRLGASTRKELFGQLRPLVPTASASTA